MAVNVSVQSLTNQRVLLIHPGIYDALNPYLFPPWGILCVASVLRERGADVYVHDLNGLEVSPTLSHLLASVDPTVVGFTGKLGHSARRLREAVDIVQKLAPHLPVAVGGPLVSVYPDITLPLWNGVDALVWGDGEDVFAQWVEDGCPRGTVIGPSEVRNLDHVGMPLWWPDLKSYVQPPEYWPNMDVPAIHVSAARGCTRRCTFCYLNAQYPGSKFRFISADRLVADLLAFHDRLSVDGFYFVDDCFIDYPPRRIHSVCDALIGMGSPFRLGCDIQLPNLDEVDLLRKMYAAGFRSFYLGIEAASPQVRKRLGKGKINESVATALRQVLDMGFLIRASIGMGWPGETEKEVEDTLALIDAVPNLLFDAYRYLPLPGVPLTSFWSKSAGSTWASGADISPMEDYSDYNRNHSSIDDNTFERLWSQMVARRDDRFARAFGRADHSGPDDGIDSGKLLRDAGT